MKHRCISAYLTGICLLVGAIPAAGLQEELSLFTEEEAETLRIKDDAWDPVPRARSATLGPLIVVEAPKVKRVDGGETIETTTPTSMTVVFEENEAPVDMRSLEISAKKGLFSKSLTDMLRPYVAGTILAVENIEVPVGKYQIQIIVEDLEGHTTSRTYRLIVSE